ncbi:MAG: hypothetical protein ETSY1_28705 [Candidatus Entotheonella factor]|uniref:OmpA family protein n=1 Tax=Entotheonella factor TaxID=1429438 RepID=W4LD42_ENTF1|nr:MAG: hypothetical protein ETSY1_28705 [Candidatus Entotheonella factor]
MDHEAPPANSESNVHQEPDQGVFDELRQLLLEPEREQIQQLEGRLERWRPDPDGLGRMLPEALVRRAKPDAALGVALYPTIEEALKQSVKKNPVVLVEAIAPLMMPAIRKAIAQALQGMMQSMNELLEHSISIRALGWRWQAFRTGKPYAEVALLNVLLYRVEQVFLIHRETGLLLCHVSAEPDGRQDPEAISGMMAAIQDFVHDAFQVSEDATLDTFQVGSLTGWVERGSKAYLAVLVRGTPPPDIRIRLQDTLAQLHQEYHDPLDEFQGDNKSFETAEPALEACLLSQRAEAHRPLSPVFLWFALGLVLGMIGLGLGSWWQVQGRWERYVERLRDMPGIVVTRSEKRWGSYVIHGLRDPLAPDPNTLLEEAKIPAQKVSSQWELYQALYPSFTLQRVRRMLQPPETVELTWQDGTLVASGRATRAWVERARDLTRGFPGVQAWRDDELAVIE